MKNVLCALGVTLMVGLSETYAQEKGGASQNMMGVDVQLKAAIAKAKNPIVEATK